PTSEPADRAPLRYARVHELQEARMRDRDVRSTLEVRAGYRRHVDRQRRLADGQHLRDRMRDRFDQVVDELGAGTHECRVVVGPRVVGAEDEALQVVDMWIEAVLARPADDLARDVALDRRVQE